MNTYLCVLNEGMKPAIKRIKIKAKDLKSVENKLLARDEPVGVWAIYIYS